MVAFKVSRIHLFVIPETNCRAGRYKLAGSQRLANAISFVTIEPPQPQDQDIRQQLAAGDYHNAFEQLLERYKEKVFRLCFSMVRNETQAEDLTQDIFLRVWKALPGYHGAASPSTWIYSIARNCCLSYLRKQKTHPSICLEEEELERLEESAAVQL